MELSLSQTHVEIYVGEELVEAWSTADCRIVPEGGERFRVEGTEESFLFTPSDPVAFGDSVELSRRSISERIKTLAGGEGAEGTAPRTLEDPGSPPGPGDGVRDDDVVLDASPPDRPADRVHPDDGLQPEPVDPAPTVGAGPPPVDVRSIPPPVAERPPALPPDFVATPSGGPARPMLPVIIAVVGTIVVVAIVLVIASAFFGDRDDSGGEGASTPTSLIDAAPAGLIFDEPPARFVQEWNRVAEEFAEEIVIDGAANGEAALTPFARLEWSSEGGLLARYQVVVDPTGPPEADREALAALGVAIAVADPSLDGPARGDLLEGLGLDVTAPDLGGIDAETELRGVRYSLRYLAAFRSLLFVVSPAE